MIKIAVIDDEERILNLIRAYIESGIEKPDEVEVEYFLFSQDFVDQIESGVRYDIVFSDIELGEKNGIEIGKKVFQRYPRTYLVFITSHPEYAAESYIMEAYQYILKHDMKHRLPVIVKRLIEKIKKQRMQYIIIGTETEKQRIFYKDIFYIRKEKKAKYVEYITVDGIYWERNSIEELMKKLKDKGFILADRAHIVNMEHISKISGNTIYLGNKERISASRVQLPKIKEQISVYWGKENSWD